MKQSSRQRKTGRSDLADRLRQRDEFFRKVIDPRQVLRIFDPIPGLRYFVKDADGRLMATSPETVRRLGFKSEDQIIGMLPYEFIVRDLAEKYRADDQWVIKNGKPLLNIVEMGFNEQGVRDLTVADKYPLHDSRGKVVGLAGTLQDFDTRRKLLAHLGPIAGVVEYIRDHLGEPISLASIADHASFSERHLQRLFRQVFGTTVQQFIIQSRVHAAVDELTRSDRSIAQIAMMLSFNDQSAFSNTFRKMMGISPREYRKQFVARFTARPETPNTGRVFTRT